MSAFCPNSPGNKSPDYGWNEATNRLGQNRCTNDYECAGCRTCSIFNYCQGTANPTLSPQQPPPRPSPPPSLPSPSSKHRKHSAGDYAGLAIGCFALLLCCVLPFCIYQIKQRRQRHGCCPGDEPRECVLPTRYPPPPCCAAPPPPPPPCCSTATVPVTDGGIGRWRPSPPDDCAICHPAAPAGAASCAGAGAGAGATSSCGYVSAGPGPSSVGQHQPQPRRYVAGKGPTSGGRQEAEEDAEGAASAPAAAVASAPRLVSYDEMFAATANFSENRLLGRGPAGTAVYHGMLDGAPVAVKAAEGYFGSRQEGAREFQDLVQVQSSLQHPNVLQLLEYCPDKYILVYEFMAGGSLAARLAPTDSTAASGSTTNGPTATPLAWGDRVRIAAEAASGLAFLHSQTPPVTHVSLAPSNILLDGAEKAKLAGVGVGVGTHMDGDGDAAATPSQVAKVVQDSQPGGAGGSDGPGQRGDGLHRLGVLMLRLLTGDVASPDRQLVERAAAARAAAAAASGAATGADGGATPAAQSAPAAQLVDPAAGAWPAAEALAFADLALRCCVGAGTGTGTGTGTGGGGGTAGRPDLREVVLPSLLEFAGRARPPMAASAGAAAVSAVANTAGNPGGNADGTGGGAHLISIPDAPEEPATAVLSPKYPAAFLCPITREVMREPVVAADGFTYEREAIQQWLERTGAAGRRARSPMTNLALEHPHLVPNLVLRGQIRQFRDTQSLV